MTYSTYNYKVTRVILAALVVLGFSLAYYSYAAEGQIIEEIGIEHTIEIQDIAIPEIAIGAPVDIITGFSIKTGIPC